MTDVTERHAVANQLRQAQKMEAVGQLTSGIAHDFNNLLAIIGGSIDLVTRRIAADESTRRPLEAAREAVVRGAKLNRQLMDFARPRDRDAERLRLDDLLPGLKELAEWTGAGAVAVRVTRMPEAWPCLVDRRDLEVAFLNLAVNAAAAMPDGGVLALSVVNVVADAAMASTWSAVPGDYTAVVVEDTGGGMTPEVLARAFESFFTTKAPGVGTGLGLAQVHRFAKQSGGFIAIESEPARGTRIAIHLPRVA